MADFGGADGAAPSRNTSKSPGATGDVAATMEGSAKPASHPHRDVRTLPGWIHPVTERDLQEVDVPDLSLELPTPPTSARLAQMDSGVENKNRPGPGKLHDAARVRTPVFMDTPVRPHASRWRTFALVSACPVDGTGGGQRVDERWLIEHMPNLETPWQSDYNNGDEEKGGRSMFSTTKKKAWYTRLQRAVVRNPLVPLVLRLTIWSFSLIALALGASIFTLSHDKHFSQRTSTLMAIIFDSIALVYLFYITYDEYSSKPLGLRSPTAKMRLILLDLFFIVFNSANLSLAFEALTDARGSCKHSSADQPISLNDTVRNNQLCSRQSALSGVLLVALFAWLLTFAVSVFRLVERVTRDQN